MIFLAFFGGSIALAVFLLCVVSLWTFWMERSDGELWGLGAFFICLGTLIGAFFQIADWILP